MRPSSHLLACHRRRSETDRPARLGSLGVRPPFRNTAIVLHYSRRGSSRFRGRARPLPHRLPSRRGVLAEPLPRRKVPLSERLDAF